MKNNRGSITLETVTAAAVITTVIVAALTVAYLAFSKVWVRHLSQEALICMAKGSSQVSCSQTFKRKLGPLGKSFSARVQLSKNKERYSSKMNWRFNGWNFSASNSLKERDLWRKK